MKYDLCKKGLILGLIILIFVSMSGCITPSDSPELPPRGFFMGVLPIPAEGQTFDECYYQVSQHAEFVPCHGSGSSPFYEKAAELKGSWGKTFVDGYTRGNGMFPIVHVNFFVEEITLVTPPGMDDATLNDSSWRNEYKTAVLDIVKASKPLYISIGNEVNKWYEMYGASKDDPNGFQHYVSLYEEIYDSVKKISPETYVFCIFAREIVDENRVADLEFLNMFNSDKLDIFVFTSYPYAIAEINRPSDIPDDYYSSALQYIQGKPFGFSELGWSSLEFFGGEQAQADFLLNVSSHLTADQGINLHLFGYAWLHDLSEITSIGLIKSDGTEKLGYKAWKKISISE